MVYENIACYRPKPMPGRAEEWNSMQMHVDLLPYGAARRNWKQTLISDGYLIVRHSDLEATLEMADLVGTDLKIYAQ